MSFSYDEICKQARVVLVPTRQVNHPEAIEWLNKTFKMWSEVWSQVAKVTDYVFSPDEFYRQDVALIVLGPKSQVLGCHLYSFFDYDNDCNTEMSFFRSFHPSVKNFLRKNNLRRSFSLEYLTVAPDFQGNREVSLGRTIIGLSCKAFSESLFQAMICKTRDDVKVNEMAVEYGADLLTSGEKLNGIDSSSLVFSQTKITSSPREGVRHLVEKAWSTKVDHSGMTMPRPKTNIHSPLSPRVA
jgi:hypothetical protein